MRMSVVGWLWPSLGSTDPMAPAPSSSASPLDAFAARTREWFVRAFEAPTEAQAQAWPAIATGEHVLISAPTGSGKTLAAFLWALDRLAAERSGLSPSGHRERRPAGDVTPRRTRLVYVSPLKALSYDIERNLQAPLKGIGADLRVAIRTGDTPQRERQQMLREPPDVLITTPESLYLMLTSRAREILRGAEWCIVDEIHAVAGTKRGAHLALTLERLDALARCARGPADRPLGDAEPARGGRALHGRPAAAVPDRRHGRAQAARPQDPRAGRVDGRAGCHAGGRARPAQRRHGGDAPLDLAGDLPGAAEADPAAPLDDPVRQQPPLGRADRAAAERAGDGG